MRQRQSMSGDATVGLVVVGALAVLAVAVLAVAVLVGAPASLYLVGMLTAAAGSMTATLLSRNRR